ncbi:hypothetical protein GCM10009785_29340 [Brooklawnia cerclae]|uniref:Uncharacterized protein n=1 Tax=Brooklawnia cerclae TaxID=349934 RepID=A0ABX0SI86_9ACTN|nr:hypothetical protein [Brooklawnia cerclae]NIH56775.1 hypothetical protein [Brooklawnia cerclae]
MKASYQIGTDYQIGRDAEATTPAPGRRRGVVAASTRGRGQSVALGRSDILARIDQCIVNGTLTPGEGDSVRRAVDAGIIRHRR